MTTNATPPPDLELSTLQRPPSSAPSQLPPEIALKRRISTWWVTTVRPVLRTNENDPRDYLGIFSPLNLPYVQTPTKPNTNKLNQSPRTNSSSIHSHLQRNRLLRSRHRPTLRPTQRHSLRGQGLRVRHPGSRDLRYA